MLWVPCIRIDLPWDAAAEDAHRAGVDLQALVEVLERATVQMVSVAVSAAGLGVLERAGFAGALTQLARLCDARRVELLGTAAHGALLPLMPAREIERQLELNEIANRRWFGDAFRPDCLWAPELAVSHRVAEVASALDYTAMLVDEAALRVRPGQWSGERIDWLDRMAGFFLVPVARDASRSFAAGDRPRVVQAPTEGDTLQAGDRYLVTAVDLVPPGRAPRALATPSEDAFTGRVQDLFHYFPLDHVAPLLPCSRRATRGELAAGRPFAAWCDPEDGQQRRRWQLLATLVDLLDDLQGRGYAAVPSVMALRATLDRSWRESWWRTSLQGPVRDLEHALAALGPLAAVPPGDEALQVVSALRSAPSSEMGSELGTAAP